MEQAWLRGAVCSPQNLECKEPPNHIHILPHISTPCKEQDDDDDKPYPGRENKASGNDENQKNQKKNSKHLIGSFVERKAGESDSMACTTNTFPGCLRHRSDSLSMEDSRGSDPHPITGPTVFKAVPSSCRVYYPKRSL